MKKNLGLFFFTIILFSINLISCRNLFGSDNSGGNNNEHKQIVFSGNVAVSQASYRAAVPEIQDSDGLLKDGLVYFAYAVADGISVAPSDVEFGIGNDERSFTIKLLTGYTWTVTVGIRNTNDSNITATNPFSATNAAGIVLKDTYEADLTIQNPVMRHDFYLLPASDANADGTAATGSISIEIKVPESFLPADASETNSIILSCSNADWKAAVGNGSGIHEISCSSTDTVTEHTVTKTISLVGIKGGSYDVTIDFKKGNFYSYSTVQTITVFSNFCTEKWVSDGTDIIKNGVFELTDEIIKNFEETTYYVGTNANQKKDPSDSNSGSGYYPLATLQEALDRITKNGDRRNAYKIYVSGQVEGGGEISGALTSAKAESLLISGFTGSDSDAIKRTLTSLSPNGSVLTVNTSVPVTIKKLTVTGGKTSGYGGGILFDSVSNSGRLILDGDVVIKNNGASDGGGGIAVYEGDTVIMNGGCSINENRALLGGGVYIKTSAGALSQAKFVMNGGEVKANCSSVLDGSSGGGVYVVTESTAASPSEFLLNGGSISENSAKMGGGIANIGSKVTLTGGTISENTAVSADNEAKTGGALYIDNTDDTTIGGNISIPYGCHVNGSDTLTTSSGYNDIWLKNGKTLGISGSFANHNATNKIGLTSSEFERGIPYVSAASSVADYAQIFKITDSEWSTRVSPDTKKLLYTADLLVSENGNDDTGNGTNSHPFASIKKACSVMNESYFDYVINVSGTIPGAQEIPEKAMVNGVERDVYAQSITIVGKNTLDSNGLPSDVLFAFSGNEKAMLTINLNCDVTIKNLEITGGNNKQGAGNGGGINLVKGTLTLDEDVVIKENHANGEGAGIYVGPDAELKINANPYVYENTRNAQEANGTTVPARSSNVYLSSGKTITVLGELLKDGDSAKKARIGVTTEDQPALNTSVPTTENYGYDDDGFNEGVVPGRYFRGDAYGVTFNNSGEACLALSSGNIELDNLYYDVTIDADTKLVRTSKKFDFTTTVNIDGEEQELVAGDGENEIQYFYELRLLESEIPVDEDYYDYEQGDSSLLIKNTLPAGLYALNVNVLYKGKSYNTIFDVEIEDYFNSYVDITTANFPNIETSFDGSYWVGDSPSPSNSKSTVFRTGRNLGNFLNSSNGDLIACDHTVTQGEYEKFMTYYGAEVSGTGKGMSGNTRPYVPSVTYGKGEDYPAYYVNWYEAVMYCNLKSIADHLTPVYYLADASGDEVENGRDVEKWRQTAGTNIAKNADGKYYYNSVQTNDNALDWSTSDSAGDSTGGIRMDEDADGWRLPTEVEWEWLARGGNLSGTQFSYSGSNNVDEVAWYGGHRGNADNGSGNSGYKTHEVKQLKPNAFGLYDMTGNIWELCWDWKSSGSTTSPVNTDTGKNGDVTGTTRVLRGGSFFFDESYGALGRRSWDYPGTREDQFGDFWGFRVVRSVSPES